MSSLTQSLPHRLYHGIIVEPLRLVADQPQQVLLSTASVALMAQFAAHGDLVHPAVGYVLAVGVEWAYLRGLADDARAPSRWGASLAWVAFATVLLWGVLWALVVYGAIPTRPQPDTALWLALAHVAPIAGIGLCAAMAHRHSGRAEADRAARIAEAETEAAIEAARKRAELATWVEGQRLKAQLKADGLVASPMRHIAYHCPHCGTSLATAGEYGAAKRWGHCKTCKEVSDE
jgi:hypothetical protein